MTYQSLFETIDSLYEEYLSVWEDLCNIESPTRDKAGVDAASAYLAARAEKRGWLVERMRHAVAGDVVCITLHPEADAAPITLSGHLDTVHPRGLFGTPAVHRDDEKIYGPGVTDCKGGIVAAFLAMHALDRCGFSSRPVRLLLQTDEEGGSAVSSHDTIRYICEKAKDSVAFLNLEGCTPGEACIVRKGIATFTFTVQGKAAHASLCAKAGANAIVDAAYKIIELEKMKDHDGLTCNCGVINGGTVPNTVPEYCEFKANVRFATAEQLAFVRDYVEKLAATVHVPGCTCTVMETGGRVAMEYTERNAALLERMNEIFAECDLSRLAPSKRTGGSDAADVTVAGIPCVDSIGVAGGFIHSVDEFAWLDSLRESAKRLAVVCCKI